MKEITHYEMDKKIWEGQEADRATRNVPRSRLLKKNIDVIVSYYCVFVELTEWRKSFITNNKKSYVQEDKDEKNILTRLGYFD